jgi:hypothetical protein
MDPKLRSNQIYVFCMGPFIRNCGVRPKGDNSIWLICTTFNDKNWIRVTFYKQYSLKTAFRFGKVLVAIQQFYN